MSHPARVRAVARAKLTLSLRVLGRREDGFHEIDALVASVTDPHDELEVERRPEPGVELEVDGGGEPAPPGAENLVVRAARLVGGEAGVAVRLRKGIPVGAGLGGGSADAAAALLALACLLSGDAGSVGAATAAELGSDVPFCLAGGLARVRGRGERVEPVAPVEGWAAALVVPPFGVATAAVYQNWDELGGPRSEHAVPAPDCLRHLEPVLGNDLEPAAVAVEPRLAVLRRALEDVGFHPVLAGSGSSYAVVADGSLDGAREELARAAAATGLEGVRVFLTGPAPSGVELSVA